MKISQLITNISGFNYFEASGREMEGEKRVLLAKEEMQKFLSEEKSLRREKMTIEKNLGNEVVV
jgi:hypothetical protein